MKVLLLGVGMQGKAALHDLVNSDGVDEVIAADREISDLQNHVESMQYGGKVQCEYVDAEDDNSLDSLLSQEPDVAIELLHKDYQIDVAKAAVKWGIHLVNAFYAMPGLFKLNKEAKSRDVSVLPEFGLDPGIDLVLLGRAVRSFDKLEEIAIYGTGIPEPEAADNPIKYRVSWTLEGVLESYVRPARIIRNGDVVRIENRELFLPENVHEIDVKGIGHLEAFPNEDAVEYVARGGIDVKSLQNVGRYTLRWPGHSEFWRKIVDLHLLDDEAVSLDGAPIDRKRFLAAAVGPHIQYGSEERDIVILRIEVTGLKDQNRKHAIYQLIDRRDLRTGLTAMSRTVGFTASIGAQMIGSGVIQKRGILSPATDVPYEVFNQELNKRGMKITSELVDLDSRL